MSETTTFKRPHSGEEIANSITHGIGIVLAIAGLGVLTAAAGIHGNAWHMVGVSVFGGMLILMYTASTLYHSIRNPRAKSILQVLDHCAIFLLIAGTYTPFTLVTLHGPLGMVSVRRDMGACHHGDYFRTDRPAPISCGVDGVVPGHGVGHGRGHQTHAGGHRPRRPDPAVRRRPVIYLGISFYLLRKLPYHHAIWHLFVLAGSSLHFFAILFYVIPAA
jgi:hemolysin III